MRFNYTNGKEAKYLVAIHYDTTDDYYYFNRFNEAKRLFNSVKEDATKAGRVCSLVLSDLKADVRKDFYRVGL